MAIVKARLKVPGQNRKVAAHANNVIPEHMREVAGGIPDLLNAYYRWADLPGNFHGDSKRFMDYLDVNKTTDELFAFIKDSFLRQFPNNTKASIRHLMGFAKDFYSTRGSIESYRFLFRAVFGEEITIDYPGNSLFATSNGEWVQRTIMRCLYTDTTDTIVGRRVYGISSGASAVVKELSVSAVGADLVADAVLTEKSGKFIADEILETRDADTKVISRAIGVAGSYTITNKGLGYKEGKTFPILATGDGQGFLARVGATGQLGEILTVDIISTGSGYVYSGPELDTADGSLVDLTLPMFTPADITINIAAEYEEGGRYSVLRSSGSGADKLQDGVFYQDFSYVIKTNVPLVNFDSLVKALVHPAGTIMYAQPNISSNPSSVINNDGSILYHLSRPYNQNYRNIEQNSYRKFMDVDVYFWNEADISVNGLRANYITYIENIHAINTLDISDNKNTLSYIRYVQLDDASLDMGEMKTMSLASSTKLDQIAAIKLDDLVNFSKLYGLSTRAAYSSVVVSP